MVLPVSAEVDGSECHVPEGYVFVVRFTDVEERARTIERGELDDGRECEVEPWARADVEHNAWFTGVTRAITIA